MVAKLLTLQHICSIYIYIERERVRGSTGPTGEELVLDVMVTSPPDPVGPPHDHLQAQARAKASRYHCQPNRLLPQGGNFIPLIANADVPSCITVLGHFLRGSSSQG